MEIYFLGLEIIFFCYWIEFLELIFSLYFRNIHPAVRLSCENMIIFLYLLLYIFFNLLPEFRDTSWPHTGPGVRWVRSHWPGRFGTPPSMLPKQLFNFYKKLYHILVKKSKLGILCYIFNKLYFWELWNIWQCLPSSKC